VASHEVQQAGQTIKEAGSDRVGLDIFRQNSGGDRVGLEFEGQSRKGLQCSWIGYVGGQRTSQMIVRQAFLAGLKQAEGQSFMGSGVGGAEFDRFAEGFRRVIDSAGFQADGSEVGVHQTPGRIDFEG